MCLVNCLVCFLVQLKRHSSICLEWIESCLKTHPHDLKCLQLLPWESGLGICQKMLAWVIEENFTHPSFFRQNYLDRLIQMNLGGSGENPVHWCVRKWSMEEGRNVFSFQQWDTVRVNSLYTVGLHHKHLWPFMAYLPRLIVSGDFLVVLTRNFVNMPAI